MKKLLLALALLLAPSAALAQCNGVFPNNTACGNITGGSNTPRAIPLTSFPANSPGGTSGQIQYNNSGAFGGFGPITGDLTLSIPGGVSTLATVNSNVGTFGSASNCATFTTNAKGLITAASQTACVNGITGVYDVTHSGLIDDARAKVDGNITSGSHTFTSATYGFASSDVGKTISITGAGAGGITLVTTISAFTNGTTVTLTTAASATATNNAFYVGTDNGPLLNTLMTTIGAGGAVLWFPFTTTGGYLIATTVNVSLSGFQFVGQSSGQISLVNVKTSGTGPGFNVHDVAHTQFKNLTFSYSSPNFGDNLVTVTNSGVTDPAGTLFENDVFNMPLGGSGTGVGLNKSIETTFNNTWFIGGNSGVDGQASGGYANVVNFNGGQFSGQTTAGIRFGGDAWTFKNVTFEPLNSGAGVAFITTGSLLNLSLSFYGCWFGDSGSATGTWITYYGNGFSFNGNQMFGNGSNQTGISLNSVIGFAINGNQFQGMASAVNYATATVDGGLLSGNAIHLVSSLEANTSNKGSNVINTGNASY